MENIFEEPQTTTLTLNLTFSESHNASNQEPLSYLWMVTGEGTFLSKVILLPFRVLLGAMIIAGNATTMVAIVKVRRLHTKTNMILCSLSISDILVGVILFVFIIRTLVISRATCDNLPLLDAMTLAEIYPNGVSLFHLAAIAVDRYMAVAWPLHYERLMTERVIVLLIMSVWLTTALLIISYSLWYISWDATSCVSPVPAYFDYTLKCGSHLCLTPFLVVLYCRIYFIGKQQRLKIRDLEVPISDNESRSSCKQKVREHRAAMMALVVSFVSILLWMPYLVVVTLRYLGTNGSAVNALIQISIGLGLCKL